MVFERDATQRDPPSCPRRRVGVRGGGGGGGVGGGGGGGERGGGGGGGGGGGERGRERGSE